MDKAVKPELWKESLARGSRPDLLLRRVDPLTGSARPTLVFVHGAFSAGWIWSEYFQPFFAELGFASVALDLRGRRSSTPFIPTPYGVSDYVTDVCDLLETIDGPCVLVGHSLGGLVAQRTAALHPLAGLALLATVPPEGLAVSSWQMALANPLLFWNTAAFAMSPSLGSAIVTQDALLSKDAPPQLIERLLRKSCPESPRALMEAQMPLPHQAGFLGDTPVCIMAAAQDQLIPTGAADRAAAFYGVEAHIIENMGHAMMVDTRWHMAAEKLALWLEREVV